MRLPSFPSPLRFAEWGVTGHPRQMGWFSRHWDIADQKAGAPAPREERGVAASGEAAGYHTALAGEPLHTVFMGKTVDIPALDRRRVTALRTSHTPKFRIVRSFFM